MELPSLKLPTKREIEFTKTFVGFGIKFISLKMEILSLEKSPVKEIDTGSL